MRLAVGQREIAHGIAEPVARQPVRTQDGIVISNGQRRIVFADQSSLCRGFVLDFAE